jgi:hypothetical protein
MTRTLKFALAAAFLVGAALAAKLTLDHLSAQDAQAKAAPAESIAQSKIPPYLNPAFMIAAPEGMRQETRSMWLVAANGDTPLDPLYSALACIILAIVVPGIVMFGYMRSTQKDVVEQARVLEAMKASGAAKQAAMTKAAPRDPGARTAVASSR